MNTHFTILLIEEENIKSQVKKIILNPEQFTITHAVNSSDAWNFLNKTNFTDLIIIDLNIPDGSHFHITTEKIIQKIKHHPLWKEIPLMIIVEQNTQKSYVKQLIANHSDSLFIEPYNPKRFINEVYCMLSLRLERHINDINEQHKEIALKIKRLCHEVEQEIDNELLLAKFYFTSSFIIEHYNFEESFMISHKYPDYKAHAQKHKITREVLDGMMNGKTCLTLESLNRLKEHVFGDATHDSAYVEYIIDLKNSMCTVTV